LDCSKDEVAALVDRFMVVGARCLDSVQVASLLGVPTLPDVMFDEGDLVWAVTRGGAEVERRMRLIVEVDGMLIRLVPDSRDIPSWLRSPNVGYADTTVTPLVAMASGAPAIRALRDYLQQLPGGKLAA
jgi:hypothetical protein